MRKYIVSLAKTVSVFVRVALAGLLVAAPFYSATAQVINPPIPPSGFGFPVSVFQYMSSAQLADVKSGALTVDTASAFTAAIATGHPVYVPNGANYKYLLGSTISVPSNTYIYGERPYLKLAASVNNHMFRIANGASNVELRGLELDGNKSSNTGGSCVAMGGTGGTNIRVVGSYIHDCSAHGIYYAGTTVYGVYASGNYLYNNYSGGVTLDDAVTKFDLVGNFAWNNGTHGIGILGIANSGSISANVSWNNGQGTPNADNFTGYNQSNSDIAITGNSSYGGLNNGIHFAGNRVTITGNSVYGATFYGIVLKPNTGGNVGGVISGNVVSGCGYSGIDMENYNSGSINGNSSYGNTRHGYLLTNLTNIVVSGNSATANTLSGFANSSGTPSSFLSITGNVAKGNGDDGLLMPDVAFSSVTGNQFNNNGAYGIIGGGAEASNLISANFARQNTTSQIAPMAATTSLVGNDTGAGTATTGTGPVVLQTAPTLATSVTVPTIIGGSGTTQSLIYKTTTGAGAAGADHIFLVGNNGGTEALRILNSGNVGINKSSPSAKLDVGVASGADAIRISNTSLSNRAWEFYPLTNGADTDLNVFEFGTTNGIRATFKAGGIFNAAVGIQIGGVDLHTVLTGTSASIGGGALTAGTCASTTVSVTGATTAMSVSATPVTYPGDDYYWRGYVSSADTVTVSVCAVLAGTPTSSAYNVRVIQ